MGNRQTVLPVLDLDVGLTREQVDAARAAWERTRAGVGELLEGLLRRVEELDPAGLLVLLELTEGIRWERGEAVLVAIADRPLAGHPGRVGEALERAEARLLLVPTLESTLSCETRQRYLEARAAASSVTGGARDLRGRLPLLRILVLGVRTLDTEGCRLPGAASGMLRLLSRLAGEVIHSLRAGELAPEDLPVMERELDALVADHAGTLAREPAVEVALDSLQEALRIYRR